MCHDISFSASTVELITALLHNAIWDGQMDIDFTTTNHVLSMSNRKCLVIYSREGQLYKNIFEWGLIANYMNTPEKVKQYRIQMANARSEKIFDKGSAWFRVKSQRCLIALDGFYEHREIKGWKNKVPYFIKLANRSNLLLLGFYNYSPLPDLETSEMKGTFTIITRDANDLMRMIHNHGPNKHRMPVLMQPEEAVKWLRKDLPDDQIKEMVQYEIPSEELEAWPVFTIRSTKPRPDGKEKNQPWDWPGIPELGNDEPLKPKATLF